MERSGRTESEMERNDEEGNSLGTDLELVKESAVTEEEWIQEYLKVISRLNIDKKLDITL